MREEQKGKPQDVARKPYRKPTLRRWGTLRELTRGGGGTRAEGAKLPKTRF